ncbi:galactose-1-phosphate uridylyltransferase, partial [Chloroflexota bacterium]
EMQVGKRVTTETESFLSYHPYASRSPFETWIVPKKHETSFGLVSDMELPELAGLLKNTLMRLHSLLGNFDFNYVICSSPTEDENNRYYDWHMIIVPRLTTPAGFEIGSGIPINTAAPEQTADLVRKVPL